MALAIAGCLLAVLSLSAGAEPDAAATTQPGLPEGVSASRDRDPVTPGSISFTVSSPFQKGPNKVEVLAPDGMDTARRYTVVYVLPVNVGTGGKWGNPIELIRNDNLHNKHQCIFVLPAFDTEPWFGDHPDNPRVRQRQYVLEVVVPLIEREFPARQESGGRMLIGFSKSALGAMGLLLRHPDVFGKAATFDGFFGQPTEAAFRTWGIADSYGTRENYDRLEPILLLERLHKPLMAPGSPRVVVMAGGPGSRVGVDHMVAKLRDLKVPHVYVLGSDQGHTWHSGWLPVAVAALSPPAPVAAR